MLRDFVEKDMNLKYEEKVAVVVVTYNPDLKRLKLVIHSLSKEVKKIVVVDNGSKNIIEIEKIAGRKTVIRMGKNKDIAEGLNTGIGRILSQHKEVRWVLTLDQDTILGKGSVSEVFREFGRLPESIKSRTGILAMSPKEKDRDMYTYPIPENINFVRKLFAQTSGNLVRAEIFSSLRFRNDFFIDQVDHEFDMNVRNMGFLIIEYDKKNFESFSGKEGKGRK